MITSLNGDWMHRLLLVAATSLALIISASAGRGLRLVQGPVAANMVNTTPLRSVGINAPYGFSANGSTWVVGGYASWAAAMPSGLKSAIIAAGFNAVRLYVDPLPLFLASSDANIHSLFAAGPLVAITDLTNAGLRVVVDFHIQGSPSSVPGWGSSDVIENLANGSTAFNRLVHCATLVVQDLLPFGNKVLFGTFNEWPTAAAFTDQTQAAQLLTYYNALRTVAPNIPLTVSGMNFADEGTLINTFDPSPFDTNTFIEIHTYNPIPFTFQDSTVDKFFQYINRLTFDPATQGQTLAVAESNAAAFVNADTGLSSGTKTSYINSINSFLTTYFNLPQSTLWLQTGTGNVSSWADSHSISRYRIFFSEFGSVGDPSADNARSYISPPSGGLGGDVLSRANYYSAITNLMRTLGTSWSVHSLEADPFEITDGTQVLQPSIISALFNGVPIDFTVPVVSGRAQVGQTLTSTQGVWTQNPLSYTFQWNRAGTPIGGATGTSYIPVVADIGSTLTSTVIATNAAGASAPATSAATVAVIAASGACPQGNSFPDGCSGATPGTAQNPTLLSSYSNRPPWNVAGVDYRVGPDTGALADPSTTLPACASYVSPDFNGGNRVYINTTPCTLSHLDFSLHGGICLTSFASSGGIAKVNNSKFIPGPNCNVNGDAIVEKTGTDKLVFEYNFMDKQYGAGGDSLIKQDAGGDGDFDIEYNEFANIGSHPLQFNHNTTTTIKYNYLHGMGQDGAHADYIIMNTAGTLTQNITESFDTIYVDATSCTLPPCTAVNTTFANNVLPSGSPQTAHVSSAIGTSTGDDLTCSAGTGNQEDVIVTGVPDSTHFTGIFSHAHNTGETVQRQAGGGTAICYFAENPGNSLSGGCNNNVYIALPGTMQSYAARITIDTSASTFGPATLNDNWIDFRGGFGELEGDCGGSGPGCAHATSVMTCNGNKKLIGGATITTVNGAPFFTCN